MIGRSISATRFAVDPCDPDTEIEILMIQSPHAVWG